MEKLEESACLLASVQCGAPDCLAQFLLHRGFVIEDFGLAHLWTVIAKAGPDRVIAVAGRCGPDRAGLCPFDPPPRQMFGRMGPFA